MTKCCEMKGFLSFLVLRLIAKKPQSGEEIRCEIERRKGVKPSPGTVYPVLRTLADNGWIVECKDCGKEKKYQITPKGNAELVIATRKFIAMFGDMKEEFDRCV